MDKQQALKELTELQARAKALEEILNAPDLPQAIHGILLDPSKADEHWYLTSAGAVTRAVGSGSSEAKYGLSFATRKTAEEHLKQLELHQRCRIAMANDWGDTEVTWGPHTAEKFVLRPYVGFKLTVDCYRETYHPFHFRTEQAAKNFVKSLTSEETLIFIRGSDV